MKNIYFSVLISLSCFVFLNGQTSDNPWAISIGANLVSVQDDAVDSKIGFGVPAVSLSRYIAGGFSIGAPFANRVIDISFHLNLIIRFIILLISKINRVYYGKRSTRKRNLF